MASSQVIEVHPDTHCVAVLRQDNGELVEDVVPIEMIRGKDDPDDEERMRIARRIVHSSPLPTILEHPRSGPPLPGASRSSPRG